MYVGSYLLIISATPVNLGTVVGVGDAGLGLVAEAFPFVITPLVEGAVAVAGFLTLSGFFNKDAQLPGGFTLG